MTFYVSDASKTLASFKHRRTRGRAGVSLSMQMSGTAALTGARKIARTGKLFGRADGSLSHRFFVHIFTVFERPKPEDKIDK